MTDQPGGTGGFRVYIRRNSAGRFVGFTSSESQGRFIKRSEALSGLTYDQKTGLIRDSAGNTAGVAAVAFPKSGVAINLQNRSYTYERVTTGAENFQPTDRQELIERQTFVRRDGTIVAKETSYGLGGKYAPERRGGWWRKQASEALGLDPGTRLSTNELQAAVLRREFLVKTID